MATSDPRAPVALLGGTFDPVHFAHLGLADDARRAIDGGASAIVVSNHGGRQLDGVAPTLRVLPEVVAAVVYKLASFVEWPSSSPAGYAICLYGNGALAEAFEAYRGRPARAGKVSVRVVPRPQAMTDCHVALVAGESDAS